MFCSVVLQFLSGMGISFCPVILSWSFLFVHFSFYHSFHVTIHFPPAFCDFHHFILLPACLGGWVQVHSRSQNRLWVGAFRCSAGTGSTISFTCFNIPFYATVLISALPTVATLPAFPFCRAAVPFHFVPRYCLPTGQVPVLGCRIAFKVPSVSASWVLGWVEQTPQVNRQTSLSLPHYPQRVRFRPLLGFLQVPLDRWVPGTGVRLWVGGWSLFHGLRSGLVPGASAVLGWAACRWSAVGWALPPGQHRCPSAVCFIQLEHCSTTCLQNILHLRAFLRATVRACISLLQFCLHLFCGDDAYLVHHSVSLPPCISCTCISACVPASRDTVRCKFLLGGLRWQVLGTSPQHFQTWVALGWVWAAPGNMGGCLEPCCLICCRWCSGVSAISAGFLFCLFWVAWSTCFLFLGLGLGCCVSASGDSLPCRFWVVCLPGWSSMFLNRFLQSLFRCFWASVSGLHFLPQHCLPLLGWPTGWLRLALLRPHRTHL